MEIWNRIERLLIGALGAAALVLGTLQVIGRYVDQRFAFIYGEEMIVYVTVWAVFLASSQLVRTDGHVRPDIVLRLLRPRAQRAVEIFNCCAAIVFCIALTYCGFEISSMSHSLDERSITGLEFPMWIYYASVGAGGLLMLIRYVIRLYRYLFRFDAASMTIAAQEH
ncbi:TRAP transporter small permease [Bradyrhizobium sp. Ai1a-2]|uniref:TRAP transporter small permease n=1 Tax=Bradyrhizobium sp. Ai1a-2 TaxID=196490 RepID=UPI000410DDBA|nr:TRAP transporter small permease [Bradyrhizobium sp. Ai1a-2]